MHLFPEAKRIRFEGRGKGKGAHDRGYYLTFNASYVVICSESRALRGGTRAFGPLQNRLRSKRNHFYAAFLALKCLPRTTPGHGVGVAPTRTRDVATPLAVHSAKSNTMRGRVQCMNAGRLDRFREMGEYREYRLACVIVVLNVLGENGRNVFLWCEIFWNVIVEHLLFRVYRKEWM